MSRRLLDSGGFLRAILSILIGLGLAAIVMWASGYDAFAAYGALWSRATGLQPGPSRSPNHIAIGAGPWLYHLDRFALAQSLAKVTPLLFTGLAVAVGLRAGLFNIGAAGQMAMGALLAAVVGLWGRPEGARVAAGAGSLSPWLHIPLALAAGAVGGGLWGGLAGLMKAKRGVHEVLSTIMLNYIALNLTGYLITHDLRDTYSKGMAPQSATISGTAWLTPLVPGSNLSAGLFLGLLAAGGVVFLFRRMAFGYEIRAVGLGAEAARASGIPVDRIIVLTMALSGALAGLAGAIEVMGIHHRFVKNIEGSYGFDGIAGALLGGLNGGGIVLSALFFGLLANGASGMQAMTKVPDAIAVIVQGVVILLAGIRYTRRKVLNTLIAAVADSDERKGDDEDGT